MSESLNLVDEIKVVEYYRGYAPPFDAGRTVRLLLRHVPAKYLAGIHGITLTNSRSTRLLRRGKVRWRERKVNMADCRGFYRGGQVTLLVDKILLDFPAYLLRLPPFRSYLIGEVLYHEIGHHIHRTKKRDGRDKEFVADEWGNRLLRSFISKRYWYLSAVATPYQLLIRPVAPWFQKKGRKARTASGGGTA